LYEQFATVSMALMFGALAGNVPVWQVEYRFAGFTKQLD